MTKHILIVCGASLSGGHKRASSESQLEVLSISIVRRERERFARPIDERKLKRDAVKVLDASNLQLSVG